MQWLFILAKISAWLGTVIFLAGAVLFMILNVPGPGGLAALFGLYVIALSLPFCVFTTVCFLFFPLRAK